MGVLPDRPLAAVFETFDALRALLAGRTVSGTYGPHRFEEVRLDFPPERPPELWVGAVGERALRLAGAKADGVLLSVLSGPAYVRWARERVAEGAAEAGRTAPPPITAYALASVDDDPRIARDAVRDAVGFFLRAEAHTALVGRSRYADEVRERGAATVGDDWLREYAVAGTPEEMAGQLRGLYDAGADTVGLWVFPAARFAGVLRDIAAEVLPNAQLGTTTASGRAAPGGGQ
ncbi:LLM class flavin-dependent oxidoreductase [Actinomadura sp. 9N215]|uniref:LLM class flavin-dependent oxidoreductase n=1 Tax=Actinomadura sp. 9N215 TaxID=3375150 RepID=UPI0037A434EF